MHTLYIHPDNPQARLIKQATTALQDKHAILLPTTFGYGLAVGISAQKTFEKLSTYLNNPTAYLVCRDVSELSSFANFDDVQFGAVRTYQKQTPPPIFGLAASKNAPKFLGKTNIYCTFAKTPIMLALLDELNEPFVVLAVDDDVINSDYEMGETYGHLVEILLAVGEIDKTEMTVVELAE